MVDAEVVLDAMDRNETGRIPDLLRGASEAERRPLFEPARSRAESRYRDGWFRGSLDAVEVVMLGTGTLTELRRGVTYMDGLGTPAAFEVLADRSPTWLESFVPVLLRADRAAGSWLLVRSLVREGLVDRPNDPDYLAMMIEGLTDRNVQYEDRVAPPRDNRTRDETGYFVHQRLLADPGLIDRELFEVFRSEAATMVVATWRGTNWSPAILRLIDDGRITRDQVLDGCLGGFLADIRPNRLGWHAQLWSSLAPTVDDLEARIDTLIAVAAAPPPAGVDVALQSFASLQEADRLPAQLVPDAVRGPLLRNEKVRAIKALKLVRVADLPAALLIQAVRPAFDHSTSAVQEAALGLLEAMRRQDPTWADRLDPALRADLALALRSVSPALTKQTSALLADVARSTPSTDDSTARHSPPAGLELAGIPAAARLRLGLDQAMSDVAHGQVPPPLAADAVAAWGPPMPPPVRDMAELTELLAVLLEDASDSVEVERALDGIARLADQDPPRSLIRSRPDIASGGGFHGVDLRFALFRILRAWESGSPGVSVSNSRRRTAGGMVDRPPLWSWLRLRMDFAQAIAHARSPGVLTAVPTHRLGWIEPSALVERVCEAPAVSFSEGILALVRLGPVGQAEAGALIEALDRIPHPFAAAVSFALGGPEVRSKDTQYDLWAHAARWARGDRVEAERAGRTVPTEWFHRDLETFRHWPGDVTVPLETLDLATLLPASADPGAVTSVHLAYRSGGADGLLQLLPSLSPATPDCVANALVPALRLALDSSDWSAAPALEGLRPPELPLGKAAHLAIVLASGAAESSSRTAAADLIIEAALDGRLSPAHLGHSLGELLRHGIVKANRVAPVLADAARSSPLVAYRISDVIEAALPALTGVGQRNVHLILEVLAEGRSLLGQSVSDGPARRALDELAARAGRSRPVVEARRILALEESDSPPHSHELAAQEAIEGRIARIDHRPLAPAE